MKVVDGTNPITKAELLLMSSAMFGDLIKAVVDIKREVMAVDAELHSDEEALLLQEGSDQADLWGINLYPGLPSGEFVEFDSMINLRPSQGNRSRGIEDAEIRKRILAVVEGIVVR